MSDEQEWQIQEPDNFKKIYKRLGQPQKNQYRSAIEVLASSSNPRGHGRFKKSLGCYAYYITSSFRILYNVYDKERIIEILDVGDHKEVYRKD